jgi:hypothetical protein
MEKRRRQEGSEILRGQFITQVLFFLISTSPGRISKVDKGRVKL